MFLIGARLLETEKYDCLLRFKKVVVLGFVLS
jgi:hypothetical protein